MAKPTKVTVNTIRTHLIIDLLEFQAISSLMVPSNGKANIQSITHLSFLLVHNSMHSQSVISEV